jgi:phage host-nuclease inhibitor protein Gam
MGKKSKTNQPHSDLIVISDWNQADEILKTIGSLQMKVKACEADATDRINEINAELQDETGPMLKDITRQKQSLMAFCDNHPEGFDGARSRELQYGKVGWRASSAITAGQKCIDKLREVFGRKKAVTYLRLKVEVNKEALEALDDATLKSVGAKRVKKDTFFAEPTIQESVDY